MRDFFFFKIKKTLLSLTSKCSWWGFSAMHLVLLLFHAWMHFVLRTYISLLAAVMIFYPFSWFGIIIMIMVAYAVKFFIQPCVFNLFWLYVFLPCMFGMWQFCDLVLIVLAWNSTLWGFLVTDLDTPCILLIYFDCLLKKRLFLVKPNHM